jgi:alpha-L-fucosidase 2
MNEDVKQAKAAGPSTAEDCRFKAECHRLWYNAPGRNFNEALPLGNGSLGAMIRGGTAQDVVCLNDDRFWAGRDAPAPVATGPLVLEEVRRRLFGGDVAGAEALVEQKLLTDFNQPYLPAADLMLQWDHEAVDGYTRRLDLSTAIAEVDYVASRVGRVRRRAFSSFPDLVFVLDAGFSDPSQARTVLSLISKTRHVSRGAGRDLVLVADAPSMVDWSGIDDRIRDGENIFYEVDPPRRCVTVVRVLGAHVSMDSAGLVVEGDFTLLVTTSVGSDVELLLEDCLARLEAAESRGFSALLERHIAAHRALYDRAALTLRSPIELSDLPTDERLRRQTRIMRDPALESLLFNYGRYLMIASSRPGSRAINLQGIWNDKVQPPWWSNYTININLQMNYWPAEPCNLAECHEPLFDFVKNLSVAGLATASVQYGMRGWVAHHQVDGRYQTTAIGALNGRSYDFPIRYGLWTMGGAWLCQHFWQHYLFNGDRTFLRETAWPILRSAAEFYLDWVVELPDGSLTTAPSTSPENSYFLPDGTRHALSIGATMDLAILREFFSTIVDAASVLCIPDDPIAIAASAALPRLPGYGIAADGQLLEWSEDLPQAEHPHRHVSHLYGVFPAAQISPTETPELAAAAARVLEERGDTGTGWSFAWKTALWARLGRPEMAYRNIGHLLNPVDPAIQQQADLGGGLYPNLLTACPPFNIDANFGYTGAVAEMLVQSQSGEIVILPALPEAWADGEARGLRCRGQVEIDMDWRSGSLVELRIRSQIVQGRTFRLDGEAMTLMLPAGGEVRLLRTLNGGMERAA